MLYQDPKNEAPVIVAVKDLGEVDNDYFLIPVGIRDHEGPLFSSFPVENRLLPQGAPRLNPGRRPAKKVGLLERLLPQLTATA